MTHNATPALGVGQIRMGRDMRLNLGANFGNYIECCPTLDSALSFNRLAQQLPGASPQDIGQRVIRKRPWLPKRNNCIFVHGGTMISIDLRLVKNNALNIPFFGKSATSSSPGYAASTSGHHQDSAIARFSMPITSAFDFCELSFFDKFVETTAIIEHHSNSLPAHADSTFAPRCQPAASRGHTDHLAGQVSSPLSAIKSRYRSRLPAIPRPIVMHNSRPVLRAVITSPAISLLAKVCPAPATHME